MKVSHRILLFVIPLLFSNVLFAGNKELMKQKRLKTLSLNEAVIKQLDDFDNDTLISFTGRVIKNQDGSVEIMVEQVEKRPFKKGFTIKPSGQYIQYMSFEEMQKLPISTNKDQSSSPYGGGAATSVK